jgi:hypothetical protein
MSLGGDMVELGDISSWGSTPGKRVNHVGRRLSGQ